MVLSTINFIHHYKFVEQDMSVTSDIPQVVFTMMLDLSGEQPLSHALASNISAQYANATKITFVTAYKNFISPATFEALAVVKWFSPPANKESLQPSDFCSPLFLASRHEDDSELVSLLESFIIQKAESHQFSYQTLKDLTHG